jgi:hypothetical protein
MRRGFFISLFVFVLSILPVAAQNIPTDRGSDFYYVNTTVEKIYPYRRGYVVQYRKTPTSVGRVYLPVEWFTDAAGKGELIYLSSRSEWPSLTIYYKNGEFSHVRFYVQSRTHETWGGVPLNVNLDSYFENVNDIRLEY